MFNILNALVPVAHAQYATTTAVSDVTTLIQDTGSGIGSAVPIILAILAGLLVLGWVVRKFTRHVTGRKF